MPVISGPSVMAPIEIFIDPDRMLFVQDANFFKTRMASRTLTWSFHRMVLLRPSLFIAVIGAFAILNPMFQAFGARFAIALANAPAFDLVACAAREFQTARTGRVVPSLKPLRDPPMTSFRAAAERGRRAFQGGPCLREVHRHPRGGS